MKIHFNGPVTGNREVYKKIVERIEGLGHELITRHAIERDLKDIEKETESDAELAAKKLETWIKRADIIVFETSTPDVSIGYEVATALSMMKPVVVLYQRSSGNVPHGLKGIKSDKLQVYAYSDDTLNELLELAIEYAGESADVRFNFFVTPAINSYLDWVSRNKKVPRSVYLRRLIEQDIEKNEEYRGVLEEEVA